MKKLKILVLILSCTLLSGCWDKVEIERRLMVFTITVDKATEEEKVLPEDRFLLTMSAPVITSSGSGSAEGSPSFSYFKTVAQNFADGVQHNLMRQSKELFFEHTKAVIFGEDLARDSDLFKEALDAFQRSHEFNKSMLVFVVAHGSEEELSKLKPTYDSLLGQYIEGLSDNSKINACITKKTVIELLIELFNQNGAGSIPTLMPTENEAKISEVAILKDYKLAGYLNQDEALALNWLKDKAQGGVIPIEYKGTSVPFTYLGFERKIKLDKIENGKIYLSYNMEFEGSVEEYTVDKELSDSRSIKQMEELVAEQVKEKSSNVIKKMQEEYKVDLLEARNYLSKFHPSIMKEIEDNYNEYFTNRIVITPNVIVEIRRVGMIK